MKKLFAVALAALMIAGMFAGCSGSGSSETTAAPAETTAAPETAVETTAAAETAAAASMTLEAGKLLMSTNAAFPPYEMTTDDGGFAGIDVEIAGEIANKLNLELAIDDMDFSAALLAVQQNKSDIVMAGVTVNEERKLVMDFSNSYAAGEQVVIVKEGSDVTMDNLGEHMIGCQAATTGYIYASDTPENGGYGEDHVIAYDSGASAVQALINGQIDCVIIDNAPATEYVKANPGLTLLDGTWVEEQYAIGMAKGNTELVNAVNKALEELTADGTIQKIIDKYIAAN